MTLNDHPKPKKRAFIYHGVAGLADFHDEGMEGEGGQEVDRLSS
jgi:hypothetical protein